jgi:uncharacterized tellurite resistance protein B-like protein
VAADVQFRLEIIKLLLQVAFADDDLDPSEAAMIIDLAKRWQLPEADITSLAQVVTKRERLPPPNLAVLKARKAEVVQLARTLQYADGSVAPDEKDMIAQIEELLG